MALVGRTGQMQSFSMKDSDSNFNWCLIGPPGSGKSVFLNEFISSSLDCGDVVRSIDLGRSQERTVELAGGQYEDFNPEKKTCLNFFTNIVTKTLVDENGEEHEEIDSEELVTIVPMIGKMAGVNVYTKADEDSKEVRDELSRKILSGSIERALQTAFIMRGREAGLQEVYEALLASSKYYKERSPETSELDMSIAIALLDYVQIDKGNGDISHGKYYSYYNGANTLELKKDYFVMELQEVEKKSPEFATIVTMGILSKMLHEAYTRPDVFKWYLIDEASDPLKDPLFVKFLENFALRIRKYNGGIGVITQLLRHFFVNNEAASLYETLAFKMFLQQGKEQVESAKNTGKLSLDPFAEVLMKSVKKRGHEYSEIMIMHNNSVMMSRLKLDPFSRWLFTSDGEEKKIIKSIREQYNFTEVEAVEYIVVKEEYPDYTEEEILQYMELQKANGSI